MSEEPAEVKRPTLSVGALAKFVVARPSTGTTLLRQYKYPDLGRKAFAPYYRDARACIRKYHRHQWPPERVLDRAAALREAAEAEEPWHAQRYRKNALALERFSAMAPQHLKLRVACRWPMLVEGVRITCSPDLLGLRGKRMWAIRLDLTGASGITREHRLVAQLLMMSGQHNGMELAPSAYKVLAVAAREYVSARPIGSLLVKDLEVACQRIRLAWPEL